MLSRESLEEYRRMTVAERSVLVMEMIRDGQRALLTGPPEIVDRRFELLRRQNDERNRRMLKAIARTKRPEDE
ncbi:MAG: hypothetical protein DWQ34_00130 [Planctomycetota bacterium]|mgnify:CR=1 FL=1|nr:MAG: hypothetical protein DWQ29_17150 [Planctomycetota bacterium]REJ98432.1 MAG: hypothetical protein DWQ34_00130 [Planctomycetota bacterium]REK23653.1 MAG: hypothetical protein DWQ41_16595 [Planctomycetota bacterium]REK31120.1 MAG: hypothetical protein DWQ45_19935 [Planctomycetota bacterium]